MVASRFPLWRPCTPRCIRPLELLALSRLAHFPAEAKTDPLLHDRPIRGEPPRPPHIHPTRVRVRQCGRKPEVHPCGRHHIARPAPMGFRRAPEGPQKRPDLHVGHASGVTTPLSSGAARPGVRAGGTRLQITLDTYQVSRPIKTRITPPYKPRSHRDTPTNHAYAIAGRVPNCPRTGHEECTDPPDRHPQTSLAGGAQRGRHAGHTGGTPAAARAHEQPAHRRNDATGTTHVDPRVGTARRAQGAPRHTHRALSATSATPPDAHPTTERAPAPMTSPTRRYARPAHDSGPTPRPPGPRPPSAPARRSRRPPGGPPPPAPARRAGAAPAAAPPAH